MNDFKCLYSMSITESEEYISGYAMEYLGYDFEYTDVANEVDTLMIAIDGWKFDNRDSFQARLEEHVIENDRIKTVLMEVFMESMDEFIRETDI